MSPKLRMVFSEIRQMSTFTLMGMVLKTHRRFIFIPSRRLRMVVTPFIVIFQLLTLRQLGK
jgi:hypothetical protein|tara:strand:+ start:242 stop:424 length:183 start_codon:yes stop_codon:yes gene_type:complete